MKITAIIADDDQDTLEMFAEYLEIKGIQVMSQCKNGKEAVEEYLKLKPDIVFTDVMMPEYDGVYALTKIRKQDPNAKVIMITANLREETQVAIKQLNATAIIHKPYNINKILEIIKNITQEQTIQN